MTPSEQPSAVTVPQPTRFESMQEAMAMRRQIEQELREEVSNSVKKSTADLRQSFPHLTFDQIAFLAAYCVTGSITKSADAAETSPCNHYVWKTDPMYRRAFARAQEAAADFLEYRARLRAVDGVLKAQYYKGEVVGYDVIYSDTLMVTLLKANAPSKFAERIKQEISHGDDGEDSVIAYMADAFTPEEIDAMGKRLEEAHRRKLAAKARQLEPGTDELPPAA